MRVKLLAAIAALLVQVPAYAAVPQSTEFPVTPYFDGMPPVRYMGNRVNIVSFGTVSQCGTAPIGLVYLACVDWQGTTHMPNPCEPIFKGELYAKVMCHELAHTNGWPSTHGP